MKKKILLLGGSGTLSKAILEELLSVGYEVSVFNRGHNNNVLPTGVLKKVSCCFFDVVVDFLSREPKDIARVYSLFMNSCHQYIFISTCCIYRRNKEDFPLTEDSPKPNKDWDYNVNKFNCEVTLKQLSFKSSSYYTIVRPYITYDDERIPIGIAPAYKFHKTIIERIRAGKPMIMWDDGNAITTVTHTCDFSKGVVGLMLNEKAKNEAFHITSNFQYSGKTLLLELYSALGQVPNIISLSTDELCNKMPKYAKMLKGDRALDASFDNSKIKSVIPGLCFTIDIKKGLQRIIKHYDSIEESEYDYEFDAQLDRVARFCGVKTKYVKYPGTKKSHKIQYNLYKNLPYRFAKRAKTILNLS